MDQNGEMKMKELIYTNYAAEVKKELMQDLDDIFHEMSAELFLPLTDIPVQGGNLIDTEDLFKKFKDIARRRTLENYSKMWDSNGLPECLAALQCLREEASDKSREQWRPTGKTAREQIRPLIMKTMQKKCEYLDKQIEFQENLLSTQAPKLIEIQEATSQIQENRKFLMDMTKVHQDAFKEAEALCEIAEKANEMINTMRE
ncbi:uncharacterized protein LOC129794206 [Lutzomyia longipalpis]|uniref:Uncharacterized protein n=1 Tax=Lutzomyia longipalpis TaxID=7200 RepID=A0A1B0C939_LUTLO|nr:uncharacterized protein LOC129794206 [Lutzomyia longipalpis]